MKAFPLFAAVLAIQLLLGGCASMDGRSLVPGQSTAKDVEALMGAPAERVTTAGGENIWYYPRQPLGRQMYAVRLTPAGVVRSVDQLLTEANLKYLVPGVTTSAQAREILGPPFRTARLDRQQRDVWEYYMFSLDREDYYLYVQYSFDGLVREVIMLKDYTKEMGAASSQP